MLRLKQTQKMSPRHADGLLHVILLGRVSTEGQEKSNIEAGYQYARPVLKQVYDGPTLVKELGEVASGMRTDRPTIQETLALIEDGWPDLVLMEDLSKAYRNPAFQIGFVQNCVDKRIRLIAVGDNLDTWDDNWEITLAAATLQHGTHIPHTRRRVRRSATAAFHGGGMVLKVRAGYRKLTKDEAASGQLGPRGLRMQKLAEWTSNVDHIRLMILNKILPSSYLRLEHVVDWMNERNIPVGPYCKRKKWTVKLLIDWLRDPILCGWRQHRRTIYEYVYRTGEHTRDKNPEPEREHVPELAFMTESEWNELQTALDTICASRPNATGEQHPRHRVPRHNSISPNQHMRCLCEAFYHDCGKGSVKCANASHKPGGCWNHVQVNAERARVALIDIVLAAVDNHPDARHVIVDAAWEEIKQCRSRSTSGLDAIESKIAELKGQSTRLVKALKAIGPMDDLVTEGKALKKALDEAIDERAKLVATGESEIFSASRDALNVAPRQALIELGRISFAFSNLMKQVVPSFIIQPVQSLDSGLVRPRALITLDVGRLASSECGGLCRPLERFEVDLFDPPVHIQHLAAVVNCRREYEGRGEKGSLSKIAAELGIGRMTVKRALQYQKLIEASGCDGAYRPIHEAPAIASRWKPRANSPRPLRRTA